MPLGCLNVLHTFPISSPLGSGSEELVVSRYGRLLLPNPNSLPFLPFKRVVDLCDQVWFCIIHWDCLIIFKISFLLSLVLVVCKNLNLWLGEVYFLWSCLSFSLCFPTCCAVYLDQIIFFLWLLLLQFLLSSSCLYLLWLSHLHYW